MFFIRNNEELRRSYDLLAFMQSVYNEGKAISPKRTEQKIIEVKRVIRAYIHKQDRMPLHKLIKGDCDGFIELFEIPETSNPDKWFDDHKRLYYRPSQYDCTGQRFTRWYKVFRRNGKLICYHSVGMDV